MSFFVQDGIGMLDWVLVLAPYRKDAAYMTSLLLEHGIRAQAATAEDLGDRLAELPGVVVVTHEALNPAAIKVIAQFLADQPNWSEIPIVILLDRAAPARQIQSALTAAWPRSRQTFHQRPVAALELVSGIQSALLTRFRQREVRDYLERETELRLELNHRVKNILASVISIFQMTRRGATSIDGLSEDFAGRLSALSNVHAVAFDEGADEIALDQVVGATFAPYRSQERSAIQISGPAVLVSRAAGTTLALCLHELATNAIKYGALSTPEGHVAVTWDLSPAPDPVLTMHWAETGGPPVVEPTRVGYGTRYMRSALTGLFGSRPTFAFAPEGLRFMAQAPLSRLTQTPRSS
ncbi:MAG: sensor histidine kinase [Kaiparowitsia implicata GSE-PSE-MK54-09C]|nr:sensor histidine kinase [Kaiparowitsia implicata GSE-PSE-MK54-09C]